MSGQGGYTKAQARRIKDRIDLDMATIETRAYKMRARVGDISTGTASVELQLESLREVAHDLKAIVDRRTRDGQ